MDNDKIKIGVSEEYVNRWEIFGFEKGRFMGIWEFFFDIVGLVYGGRMGFVWVWVVFYCVC